MQHLKERILNHLKPLKGSGKFLTAHTADFIFPGLLVEGVGEVAFPVNETAAKALIAAAKKAPFGKGSETFVDDTVRNTWEIDAAALRFGNPRWAQFLNAAIDAIKPGLGLEDYDVSAHLYKLLVYESGSFFLPHRDSEKEKGMFGTLVVELPAKHTGGELVVSFEGAEETVNFAQETGEYRLGYAAFYADCEHEIKPVTSGHRVSLVYNLIQKGGGRRIAPASLEAPVAGLAKVLQEHQQQEDAGPAIILLGHQYTPENFSQEALKLADRPRAEVLLQAAKKAGYYARLCLVTSYLVGSPAYSGYDEEEADLDMEEVHDSSLSIEHWAEGEVPAFSNVIFDEDELIASFDLDEGEPLVKESTGYMGNYGPDLMHWYHYGAVMIWSPETNARLLPLQDATSQLAWTGYLAQHRDTATTGELNAARFMLAGGFSNDHADKNADYNAIVGWMIREGDPGAFLKLSLFVAQHYFIRINVAHWILLIRFFGIEKSGETFTHVMRQGTVRVLEQLLAILHALQKENEFGVLAERQATRLPEYFSTVLTGPQQMLTHTGLGDLFRIEIRSPQPASWTTGLAEAITRHAGREYIHKVLAPELLALQSHTPLSDALLAWCRNYLQQLADNKPQPPADWRRELPETAQHQRQWAVLKDFLESPVETVFDYRRVQAERSDMEAAIRHAVVDLRMETIRKGSPHTLRIIKTQAAYEREMRRWEEDVALLERVVPRL